MTRDLAVSGEDSLGVRCVVKGARRDHDFGFRSTKPRTCRTDTTDAKFF